MTRHQAAAHITRHHRAPGRADLVATAVAVSIVLATGLALARELGLL